MAPTQPAQHGVGEQLGCLGSAGRKLPLHKQQQNGTCGVCNVQQEATSSSRCIFSKMQAEGFRFFFQEHCMGWGWARRVRNSTRRGCNLPSSTAEQTLHWASGGEDSYRPQQLFWRRKHSERTTNAASNGGGTLTAARALLLYKQCYQKRVSKASGSH